MAPHLRADVMIIANTISSLANGSEGARRAVLAPLFPDSAGARTGVLVTKRLLLKVNPRE
ncbi:UNVERIFIED_ORG: hypothetical protein ABIB52_001929 [Arthrobacter sp. UYCu721]